MQESSVNKWTGGGGVEVGGLSEDQFAEPSENHKK